MNPYFRRSAIPSLLGLALGLGLLLGARGFYFRASKTIPAAATEAAPEPEPKSRPELASMAKDPLSASQLLAFSSEARQSPLSESEILLQLEAGLLLPETSQKPTLCMLLIHWAERDPLAAMSWIFDRVSRPERRYYFKELGPVWANQDAPGFAEWFKGMYKSRFDDCMVILPDACSWLAPVDLTLYAKTWEHPGYWGFGGGRGQDDVLPNIHGLDHARQLALQAAPHVQLRPGRGMASKAYLDAAAWPEDMKFKTRASAYSAQ